MKKYMLTKEVKKVGSITLRRIKALKDFGNVKKDDLGGWIEKEDNLSQENNCWVYGDAMVFGNAEVFGNAWVSGNAKVNGNMFLCCKFSFKTTKKIKEWLKIEEQFKEEGLKQ